jgi:hypothetical protein
VSSKGDEIPIILPPINISAMDEEITEEYHK